jgi:hypothetical protein
VEVLYSCKTKKALVYLDRVRDYFTKLLFKAEFSEFHLRRYPFVKRNGTKDKAESPTVAFFRQATRPNYETINHYEK